MLKNNLQHRFNLRSLLLIPPILPTGGGHIPPYTDIIISNVPDFNRYEIKIAIADEGTTLSTEIPILEAISNRAYYMRSSSQLEERTPIKYSHEQMLLALFYGKVLTPTLSKT